MFKILCIALTAMLFVIAMFTPNARIVKSAAEVKENLVGAVKSTYYKEKASLPFTLFFYAIMLVVALFKFSPAQLPRLILSFMISYVKWSVIMGAANQCYVRAEIFVMRTKAQYNWARRQHCAA